MSGYLVVLLVSVSLPQTAEKVDFSGSYTLTGTKGEVKLEKETKWSLKVVQSPSAIKVTKTMNSLVESHTYPLDGSEGDYVSSFGGHGTCKGQLKGKLLRLESVVNPHGLPNDQVYKTERWELSPDAKKLTIRIEGGFNDMSLGRKQFWSEIYTRD